MNNTLSQHGGQAPRSHFWKRLTAPQATVAAALLALVPSASTAGVALFTTLLSPQRVLDHRLRDRLPHRSNATARVYTQLALALNVPDTWSTTDAAAFLGGGQVELVKRYDANQAGIGVLLRVSSVPQPLDTDPQREINNHLAVLRQQDPAARATVASVAGKTGTLYSYIKPMGANKLGNIKEYIVRLVPEVELNIVSLCFSDDTDKDECIREADDVVSSIVVDDTTYGNRRDRWLQEHSKR